MKRWYYFYLPRHIAGSGGNNLIAKCFTSEDEIRTHMKDVRIKGQVVTILTRP